MIHWIFYFIGINIVTFIIYGIDKWKAIHGAWRISERNLLLLAIAGGTLGAYVAMYVFRHKTRHEKFVYGIPFIAICQILIFASRETF